MEIKLKLPIEITPTEDAGYVITDSQDSEYFFYKDKESGKLVYDGCCVGVENKEIVFNHLKVMHETKIKSPKPIEINIKNYTDKEIKNFSLLNPDLSKELVFSQTLEDVLKDFKDSSTEVFALRYQFETGNADNDLKQLNSKFTIKYGEEPRLYRFSNFFSPYQMKENLLDILGVYINLKLTNDLDIIIEKIMPKTEMIITFFIND